MTKKRLLIASSCFLNTVFAQTNLSLAKTTSVTCNLTHITTIQTFSVYEQAPTNTVLYKAKFSVDADGSPRAYGPNNSGLDWTANAGSPGNWWGVVTDSNGDPIIQGASDPYPGMYVSTTSLVNSSYGLTNPLRYVNAEVVPYYVIPVALKNLVGMVIGDVGYVYNTTTGQGRYAIYADSGPAGKLGEGSVYLANQIGLVGNPKAGGTSNGIIEYVLFPNSGFGQGYVPSISQIDSMGESQMALAGGLELVNCLNPQVPIVIDNTIPQTAISTTNVWDTTNFVANFTDIDNTGGSGIDKSMYNVTDYSNSNEWRANNTRGFFHDDFIGTAIHPDWTQKTGTWAVAGGTLTQTDETNSNTNLFAALTQTISNRYLYHWKGSISGSGTNRRAGIHFFCDAPDSTNRGNSYFVYFRLDGDKVQTYKSVNNITGGTFVKETSYNFNANQVYDFKVSYDKATGTINVYVNDALVSTWIDSSPITTGTHISFRSGNCNYKIQNLRVYRSRSSSVTINVGTLANSYIRYQNQNPTTPSGQIKSITSDVSGNLSAISSKTINVDWTAPTNVTVLNDGALTDEDTTASATSLISNWNTATDVHSGIKNYYYSVGTTAGAINTLGWTALLSSSQSVTITGLSLTPNQKYFINIRTENNAGLFSSLLSSDGITYKPNFVATSITNNNDDTTLGAFIFPNPTQNKLSICIKNNHSQLVELNMINTLGQSVLNSTTTETISEFDVQHLSVGVYYIILKQENKMQRLEFIKN